MSKVITFSRFFPANHPRKGEPTYFVEKIWKGLYDLEPSGYLPFKDEWQHYDDAFPCTNDPLENIHKHAPKWHTIRAGNRWKVGDKFSPRVWSGKPYASKQITIAPDIEIKKVFEFEVDELGMVHINGFQYHPKDDPDNDLLSYRTLSKNDGLSPKDFEDWLLYPCFEKKKKFTGQIICWNDSINYDV